MERKQQTGGGRLLIVENRNLLEARHLQESHQHKDLGVRDKLENLEGKEEQTSQVLLLCCIWERSCLIID